MVVGWGGRSGALSTGWYGRLFQRVPCWAVGTSVAAIRKATRPLPGRVRPCKEGWSE